jgi:hypothetical protein
LIESLSKKVDSISDIIQNVFNKGYFALTEDSSWKNTKYRMGSPISLSDLGFGPYSTDESQHPLIGVINSKMVDLQKTLNLIKELRKTGSDSTIL